MLKILGCITNEHDLRLVGLSAAICALGCFTTITLLARSQVGSSRAGLSWLFAAAAVFASSVWSLHFVAMLAFMPGMSMAYRGDLTLASTLVAFLGAWLSLLAWRSRLGGWARIGVSGVLLGLGVTGMHYTGVAAMRFSGLLLFDADAIAVSVAISILLSMLAMGRARDLTPIGRRLEITGWLALSICGMHFTGMSAITVSPGIAEDTGGGVLGTSTLAVVVGVVSLALLLASLGAVLTEQHLSRRTVEELRRMRLLSNLAHEVLLIHRNGIVLEINNAGERLFGASAAALIGRPVTSFFAANGIPALARRAVCAVEDRHPEELDVVTTAGAEVPVELSCQPIDYRGKPATAVALRDLSERKRDEARIRHLARHDALTGLPNRYNLQERLAMALATASRDRTTLAILYVDLDRFKPVNDLYGHAAGDKLLVEASKCILAQIRAADMLARIGGDEFVMLLENGTGPEQASDVARRVLEAVGRPFDIDGHRIEIGASIGIALYPGDGGDAEALLRAADTAMYRVKDEGRGSLRFFEAAMDAQLQARRQLEKELSHAIDRGELLLHFQPIVNGTTGEVETFEALVRWDHPRRGMISPTEFIPLAEETGLITSIGTWVIDAACREAARWQSPWRVAVNVSPTQMRHSDPCAVVAAALDRNGLEPRRLVVEITESVLMGDAARTLQVLNRLRDMGVRVALDDFGTGYSSLSYLQRFRFDKLKIDRSFVSRLGQSEEALTITRAIVNLGHNLGLRVTAEGVETAQQLAILQALGCDQIQGYLVARPAPIEAMTEMDRMRARNLFQSGHLRLSA